MPADVTEWDEQERLAQARSTRFGRIDVVFANAGFGAERGFLDETPEHWRDMVLTNVLGAAYTIRATLEALREPPGALAPHELGRRPPGAAGQPLLGTKHAVTAMGEALRQELNGTGVRVTLIEPGHGRHAVLRQPRRRAAGGRRRRRARDVRGQPPARVDVNEILVRPTAQDG